MIPEVAIHSQKQDKRIIKSHYDNKNDLFSWFLGPKMIYTSSYFKSIDESLEDAQENKMNLIAQKIQLKEGDELLEAAIREAIGRKPKGHDFDYSRQKVAGQMTRHMSHTGG